jgi:hypothetical protein
LYARARDLKLTGAHAWLTSPPKERISAEIAEFESRGRLGLAQMFLNRPGAGAAWWPETGPPVGLNAQGQTESPCFGVADQRSKDRL